VVAVVAVQLVRRKFAKPAVEGANR